MAKWNSYLGKRSGSFLEVTLEFQIEDTAQKYSKRLKKNLRMIFIKGFSLQNARYQLALCFELTAVNLAQKLMPFLSCVRFFQAV